MNIRRYILFLGIFFLSSSFLLSGLYILLNVKSEYEYKKAVENSIKLSNESVNTLTPKERTSGKIELEAIESLSADQKIKNVEIYKNVLDIPSLNMKAYIYEGVSNENLRSGVGHFKGTKEIGENGKCCVAGHSSATYNCILNGIENLPLMEKFYVWDSNGVKHTYYLTDKFITDPEDLHVLDTTLKDKSYFTIVTCANKGHKRLILNSTELTEEEMKQKKKEREQEITNQLASVSTLDMDSFELYDFFNRERD